jgi:ABC-type dipeptide/oligopeptide/nickel transport system permease component
MLTSALLIHLTGGRIETHFHVFGSLAFLAFYRDWRMLLSATIVVLATIFVVINILVDVLQALIDPRMRR